MANRHNTPYQLKTVALSLMAAIFCAPALAATSSRIPCNEVAVANLEIPVRSLVTQLTSNDVPASSTSLLVPRAEAAIREAFKEGDSALESPATNLTKATLAPPMAGTEAKPIATSGDDDDNSSVGPVREMNARLPGVSDDTLSRYKKQMYRRDI